MENETFALDGWRFFGATLWTDFNLLGDRQAAMLAASSKDRGMNDYRKIRRRDSGRLLPHHTAMLHAASKLALTRFLSGGERTRSIVVTHQAPSRQSLPRRRWEDTISAAYASEVSDLILETGPALWIHGHIHEPCDYVIGATRVLSNPYGYSSERPNPTTFRADLVVEI